VAHLRGDAQLVGPIAAVLVERGVAQPGGGDREGRDCPAVDVTVRREGEALVVSAGGGDAPPVRREVTDVRTAATVIESWVRTDVQAPLLAGRAPASWDAENDAETDAEKDTPITATGDPSPPPPALVSAPAAAAGQKDGRLVQVFTVAETSLGSDRTSWVGAQVGACVMLGAVCAGARARFASVASGPGPWQSELDRRGVEMLLGADLPMRLGRATLSPGVAAGVGWIHTHEESSRSKGDETGGLRGEAHLALSYAIRSRLALELALSLDVTQATHVETASSSAPLPDEPRLLARLGAGVRFGGL
jgi:hypothetical protein